MLFSINPSLFEWDLIFSLEGSQKELCEGFFQMKKNAKDENCISGTNLIEGYRVNNSWIGHETICNCFCWEIIPQRADFMLINSNELGGQHAP